MKLADLVTGQTVHYRTGTRANDEVVWSGWKRGSLKVKRQDTTISSLTLPEETAVFAQGDYDPQHRVFVREDYLLDIGGLTV